MSIQCLCCNSLLSRTFKNSCSTPGTHCICVCKLIVVTCIPSFFCAFSSVVRQMPRQNPQRWVTAWTLPNLCVVLRIVCFVSFCILFVHKCVLYYCHRVAIQLQSINISYHIISRPILRTVVEKNISFF